MLSHKPAPSMVAWLLLLPAVAAFTRPASPVRVFQLRATASSDDTGMRDKYLSRLGIDAAIVDRPPNAERPGVLFPSTRTVATPSTRRVPPAGLCVLAKGNGHVMLGKDYIKTVERGVEVSRTELPTEKEWREALEANFGITL